MTRDAASSDRAGRLRGAEPPTQVNAPSSARPSTVPAPHQLHPPATPVRAERIAEDTLRALEGLHEHFARNFGAALSALLRTIVGVKLAGLDQVTYSELTFRLEELTCFNVLRAAPLPGNLVLDISPRILYPIIDRLLGGGREPAPPARRPLTQIELRLVARITGLLIPELRRAWLGVQPLDLAVERVECRPPRVQLMPANEPVLLFRFELTVGQCRGVMTLCIPSAAIAPLAQRLVAVYPPGSSRSVATVELVAVLAETKVGVDDLRGLRVGDILTTEAEVDAPIIVSIDSASRLRAQLGALGDRKAILVEEILERDE